MALPENVLCKEILVLYMWKELLYIGQFGFKLLCSGKHVKNYEENINYEEYINRGMAKGYADLYKIPQPQVGRSFLSEDSINMLLIYLNNPWGMKKMVL